MPTAAWQLVETLRRLEVDRVFCVPGESYLPALDALTAEPAIDLVTCRHESGAGLMAVADAKLTSRPGVAFVSRGPGATNAALAVHTAEQDGAPLVLFIGQLPRRNLERGVFQKIDYVRTFGDMAKQVVEVREGHRLAATVVDAFRAAMDGTPGPVIVSIPEDLLAEEVRDELPAPIPSEPRLPPADAVADVARRLTAADRPLLLVGGGARSGVGRTALAACVERWQVPVATSYKHQEKQFPGRVAGTTLTNPDFAALGAAFGALGLTIDSADQADSVVQTALAHDGPVVVDVHTSLERLSTFSTLSGLAAAARQ